MEHLFPSYDNISEDNLMEQSIHKPIFRTIDYKIETIIEKIINIDDLSDDDVKFIISRQHNIIFNYDLFLSSSKTRTYAQQLFTNKRFLKLFCDIVGLIEFDENEIICINKLAYDYYILPNKDEEISSLLLQISYNINNIDVIKLSSKLGINGARILSMISKSTFKIDKKVHRVNSFLVKFDMDLTSTDIADILFMIYNRFTPVIIHTLLEVPVNDMLNEEKVRFDAISSAILTILLSLTSDNMKKVLYDYAFTLRLSKKQSSVRFSLRNIDPRMDKVIEEIELDPLDTLYIP